MQESPTNCNYCMLTLFVDLHLSAMKKSMNRSTTEAPIIELPYFVTTDTTYDIPQPSPRAGTIQE